MKKLGLLLLAVMMIGLSSCGGDNANKAKEGAEKAVEATKDAAKEAGDAVKEAAEKTADAAKEAGEAVKDAAKEATADVNGKDLFTNNGCVACHQADKKTVGPAIKDIAAAYAGKKDELVKFLKGEGKAIVDPAQFAIMQPNLNTTKNMKDAEVAAIADYMLSVK